MILTTIALVAQATPAAAATQNAAIAATAKAWFISLQQGKLLDPKALTKKLTASIPPDGLAQLKEKLGPLGPPTSFVQSKTLVLDGSMYYFYDMGFKSGMHLNFIIAFDKSGKISDFRAVPQ